MSRLKTIPVAIAGLFLSAGAVFGFAAMPDAATRGLTNATEKSGHTVPARPATVDAPAAAAPDANATAADETTEDAAAEDAPPADTHGAAVSVVAKAEDTTPDTNHGARRLRRRQGQPWSGDRGDASSCSRRQARRRGKAGEPRQARGPRQTHPPVANLLSTGSSPGPPATRRSGASFVLRLERATVLWMAIAMSDPGRPSRFQPSGSCLSPVQSGPETKRRDSQMDDSRMQATPADPKRVDEDLGGDDEGIGNVRPDEVVPIEPEDEGIGSVRPEEAVPMIATTRASAASDPRMSFRSIPTTKGLGSVRRGRLELGRRRPPAPDLSGCLLLRLQHREWVLDVQRFVVGDHEVGDEGFGAGR